MPLQVWEDAVSDANKQPTGRSQWNSAVRLLVNAWNAHKAYRTFDFANAGYQVQLSLLFKVTFNGTGFQFRFVILCRARSEFFTQDRAQLRTITKKYFSMTSQNPLPVGS